MILTRDLFRLIIKSYSVHFTGFSMILLVTFGTAISRVPRLNKDSETRMPEMARRFLNTLLMQYNNFRINYTGM